MGRNVCFQVKNPFWILKIHRKKAKNGKFRQDLARFGQKWPEFARNSQVLASFGEFWQEKLRSEQFGKQFFATHSTTLRAGQLSVISTEVNNE